MSATVNALIARGVDPIGSGLPQVANMLNAKQAQDTQAQYSADNHNALLDQQRQTKEDQDAKRVVAEVAQLYVVPDEQLPSAIQQMPHVVQALSGANIGPNNIPAIRATLDHVGRAAAAHLGIEPPRPKYGAPVAGSDANGHPTFRRFNESGPDSIPVSGFAPPAKEETFGAPTDLVMGGKPSVAQIGSQGTVRPVAGATPYDKPTAGSGGGAADPSDVESWAYSITSGNATMGQVPKEYKTPVARYLKNLPQSAFSPLAGSRYTLEATRIAANYLDLPQYKLTAGGLPYLQRIDAAEKNPGSVSDEDLLDSLVKLNTGGNAVTEAQVNLITKGRSFSDSMGVFKNKLQNGGVLSPDQRKQVVTLAKAIFDNYKKGYAPVYNQLSGQLKMAGIPEQFWSVPDLNNLSAQIAKGSSATPTPASPPPKNAKGWGLHKDANGNLAYVSPDGKSYEEVQR